jgi:dipeptidase
MCDTVCALRPGRTLFAKNSDRPVAEVQLIESLARREPNGLLRTQYLSIDDLGAAAVLGSRPAWLWGLEHGINEHGVAIGNERVFTADDPARATPALIGMDLVRLGLERGRTAGDALDTMTRLLERHGQGGIADADNGDAYYSSFLIADHQSAWILETSGRTWAAKSVTGGAAISNRIALGTDWTRASADVAAGDDFGRWRDPESWLALADVRLACTLPAMTGADAVREPADLAALMRHHGDRAWGKPGDTSADEIDPLPDQRLGADGEGVSVCMHLRDYQATAASMICELPAPGRPLRAWVACGSPCVSVFVPVFPTAELPIELADSKTWRRFAALRARVEAEPNALREVRAVLAPLETALWAEADELVADPRERRAFVDSSWRRVDEALRALRV